MQHGRRSRRRSGTTGHCEVGDRDVSFPGSVEDCEHQRGVSGHPIQQHSSIGIRQLLQRDGFMLNV